MTKKNLTYPFLALAITCLIFACSKTDSPLSDDSSQNGNNNSGNPSGNFKPLLQIRLHDAPAAYDSVVVDIQEVRIKMNEDSLNTDSGWISLPTNAGLYDLLSLQNGLDTLISSSPVPADTLTRMALVLGSNNYVVENGTVHPLFIPSGSQSGLKITCNRILSATLETISLDFDAEASIHKTGNGRYILNPVLKLD